MGQEIERKFLIKGNDWPREKGKKYRQGYLSLDKERTVRVRLAGDKGYLTIKGKNAGASRSEFEYEIPKEEAETLLDQLCLKPLIEKTRYKIDQDGLTWEIDEFSGENKGLILAEIELEREDQPFDKPAWLGQEVTDDPRYYNANLVQHPFSEWSS